MTARFVFSSFIFTIGCYLAWSLITITGSVFWIAHLFPQIPHKNDVEKREIVEELSIFLHSQSRDSRELRIQVNLKDAPSPILEGTDHGSGELSEWLTRENQHRMLEEVRDCLPGEDNELLLGLLVANYPRDKWSPDDYDFSQKIVTQIFSHWESFQDIFKSAVNSMQGVEFCNGQRQILEEVIASAGSGQ